MFQSTTVGLGGEVVPRLQWREQWLGGNLKLENIFCKSNLVDGSFHFSFLMKQRLQSLKLPAMATKEPNQKNSVDTFLFKEGPPPKKKSKQLEPSLKQLAPLLMKNSIKFLRHFYLLCITRPYQLLRYTPTTNFIVELIIFHLRSGVWYFKKGNEKVL